MNKNLNLICIRALYLIAIIQSLAIPAIRSENELKFNHLSVINGLFHNSVTAIAQDSVGFIWLGTQRGLNRFDGYKIDKYLNNSDLFSTVFNNRIRRIAIARNQIWVATYKGLQCFDIRTKKYINFKDESQSGLSKREVIHFEFIDSQNRIWIGSQSKLECALISGHLEEPILKNIEINQESYFSLVDTSIPEIVELSNGMLFLLADGKILRINEENNNKQRLKAVITDFQYSDIKTIKASGNDLWIFLNNKAIGLRLNDGIFKQFDTIEYPSSSIIRVAFSSNNIWLSTNHGLVQINRNIGADRVHFHYHSIIDPFSVSSNHQSGIYIDTKNNLWVSTWSGGVSYADINKPRFNLVRYMPSDGSKFLPAEFVYSIHEDRNGHIFVGTKFGGLSKFNPDTKKIDYTININDKLNVNSVIPCITSDEENIYVVITTGGSSIFRINKKSKKTELVKSYKPQTIFSFGFDSHQQLWVGVLGSGLSCLKTKQGKVVSENWFTTDSDPYLNLTSNQINYVFNDLEKNEVLVSTTNGLNRLMLNQKGEVESIAYYLADEQNSHSLSSNYVWPIDKENDSTYWVGTLGSGLNRVIISERVEGVAKYKADRFGVKEGAPSNDIESLLVDKYGNVWFGGYYLSRFNYNTRKFKTFYEEDGLQSYLFGTGTSCKSKTGMLYFGGMKGLNYFMPDTIDDIRSNKVFFSRILLNGMTVDVGDTVNGHVILKKDLQYTKSLRIPYPINILRIEFTSLTFTKYKNIQYRYKLKGYDKDWNYTDGLSAFASYSKLPYKKYEFDIEVGEDNNWSATDSSFEIIVQPPWWQSYIAIIIYSLLFILTMYLIFRYSINWIKLKRRLFLQDEREKQKEELLQLKMNFFTNISHEFKTPLTIINAAVYEIESKKEIINAEKYFQVIKRSNIKLLNLIRDLMDFQRADASLIQLNTSQVDMCKFLKEIFDEFQPLSEKYKISMNLNLPGSEINAWIDEEIFTKIITNIISNSLRYTETGGKIEIQLGIGNIIEYKTKFSNKVSIVEDITPGNHLIFSVTDTGVGISPDSLPLVFERFHTYNANKSKHPGSGVGLALVKSLVELHKGGIIISSQKDVGTEFVFSIPQNISFFAGVQNEHKAEFDRELFFNDFKEQIIDFIQPESFDDNKQTLLFVDDNIGVLSILCEHFKSDYNILTAFNGEEALKICYDKFPDLIISDVMMPIMDGLELCNRVKSQLKTCFIPVILLTARSSIEQQIEGLDEGADAYIPKPFHLGVLNATIINLLNKVRDAKAIIKEEETNADLIQVNRNVIVDKENQQFIDKLSKIILNNLENSEFTIDNLCREIGVSRSRLYSQIKIITNATLGDFIREIRMKKAVEILRSTTYPISEIAYMVGFDNPSCFTRTFKKRFGIPPTEFVKRETQ